MCEFLPYRVPAGNGSNGSNSPVRSTVGYDRYLRIPVTVLLFSSRGRLRVMLSQSASCTRLTTVSPTFFFDFMEPELHLAKVSISSIL